VIDAGSEERVDEWLAEAEAGAEENDDDGFA
jgi:hypothetical protein